MNYWLVKTEPSEFSWADLQKTNFEPWTGVRNYQARNFLKEMKVGDLVFVYHSGAKKSVEGVAEVYKSYYQDPTTDDDRWVAVDLKAKYPLKRAVSLEEIKKQKKLSELLLLRQTRLSVMPLSKTQFETIINLSNE